MSVERFSQILLQGFMQVEAMSFDMRKRKKNNKKIEYYNP